MIAGHGLPFATACAYAAGLFELAVGVLLIVGLKVRPAALAAVAYLALVTALFHWHPAMHGDHGQMLQLLKNLGLAGGLVLLSSTGPGSMALERG
jgi:putative oxidoreductase